MLAFSLNSKVSVVGRHISLVGTGEKVSVAFEVAVTITRIERRLVI